MFMMWFFTVGTIFLALGMSFWSIYIGNLDTENWFIPYRNKLPIDKSSLFGWYCELLLQAFSGYAFVMTITCTVTFFGACSFYIEACLMQFRHMFTGIDEDVKDEQNFQAIEGKIFDTIIFHNKFIDVFDIMANVFSVAIFFHLICNILFFAAAIFQTEMVF